MLAVFTNGDGLVLVAERAAPRGAWQFPQGGIDPGETPETAVRREMREELGVERIEILKKAPEPIRYEFPAGDSSAIAKVYKGQEQVWFHLRFAPGTGPDLAKATDKEFVALDWVTPVEALRRIVAFKRDAYQAGLAALGLLPRPCREA